MGVSTKSCHALLRGKRLLKKCNPKYVSETRTEFEPLMVCHLIDHEKKRFKKL